MQKPFWALQNYVIIHLHVIYIVLRQMEMISPYNQGTQNKYISFITSDESDSFFGQSKQSNEIRRKNRH